MAVKIDRIQPAGVNVRMQQGKRRSRGELVLPGGKRRIRVNPEKRGALMDIAGWLRDLGLERYEAAFRENEIDWAVLPELTADDLKDIV